MTAISCLLRYPRRHNVTALFVNMVFSDEDKILIKIYHLKGYNARQLSTEFPDKGWTTVALTGCSRSSETWPKWTDVRAATDCEVPAQMKTLTR